MRHTPLLTASLVLTLVACAHSSEMQATTVTNEPVQPTLEREVIAVDTAAPVEPVPPPNRPRLSQTITLGQGQEAQYTPSAPPPQVPAQAQAGGPSQNVIVNNNVIVQGAPGYYGYGSYRGVGAYGRPTTFTNDGRSGSSRGT
ncbi:MAG: hypothetical protein K0S65_4093, partial [Labilithrix sp.]|nr:hypothetical protein [Labilithrix sp.]